MQTGLVSYLEDSSLLIMLTISAVAPVLTGLQFMINAFINTTPEVDFGKRGFIIPYLNQHYNKDRYVYHFRV